MLIGGDFAAVLLFEADASSSAIAVKRINNSLIPCLMRVLVLGSILTSVVHSSLFSLL